MRELGSLCLGWCSSMSEAPSLAWVLLVAVRCYCRCVIRAVLLEARPGQWPGHDMFVSCFQFWGHPLSWNMFVGPVEILCSEGGVVAVTRHKGHSFFTSPQWWLVRVECQGKEERSCLWLSRRDGNQTQTSSNSCVQVWHGKALLYSPLLKTQKNWRSSYIFFSSSQVLSPTPWARVGSETENQG